MTDVKKRLRVLLTNDDGPPDAKISPFIYRFCKALEESTGWEVLPVVPSSQRSWVGKAYLIAEKAKLSYCYPREPLGYEAEKRDTGREKGEEKEWILIDGTPSTCSSIGIYNLYTDTIDLVISGPNLGRNTSSSFAMSSGTVGAAMAASQSLTPAIALSYGIMQGHTATDDIVDQANRISCTIIKRLTANGFAEPRQAGDGQVDIYSINVPLTPQILQMDSTKPHARITTLCRNRYGRLFMPVTAKKDKDDHIIPKAAGPAAEPEKAGQRAKDAPQKAGAVQLGGPLTFEFKPDISQLINVDSDTLAKDTDLFTILKGQISVTPMQSAYALATPPQTMARDQEGFLQF